MPDLAVTAMAALSFDSSKQPNPINSVSNNKVLSFSTGILGLVMELLR